MYGLFAKKKIPQGTKFKGSYTGEAISRSQLVTRTEHSDKVMKINGMFVDGTDPRMASYLSMAISNTCSPTGHPNTEAFETGERRFASPRE
jgi:SET domain-containing protein